MCALIKQLHRKWEKLNESVHSIVNGFIMCLAQMKSHKISRSCIAWVDAADLQNLESQIGLTYPDLILTAIIWCSDSYARWSAANTGRRSQRSWYRRSER